MILRYQFSYGTREKTKGSSTYMKKTLGILIGRSESKGVLARWEIADVQRMRVITFRQGV